MFASVILRDLVRSGRMVQIEVPIADRPGALAELVTVLAAEGANIVDVEHDRLSLGLNPKGATLGIVVEVESHAHRDAVVAAVRERGFDAVLRILR